MASPVKIARAFLFFLISAGIFFPLTAQRLNFKQLSVQQGLSYANILDVHEDKFGFVWVGTEDGLNRYDGYNFQVFKKSKERNSNHISNNYVTQITEDDDGNLYISTRGGLDFYNRKLNRFEILTDTLGKTLGNAGVWITYLDSQHRLWVGTDEGLYCYDKKNNHLKLYNHEENNSASLVNNSVTEILEDSQHRLWVGTKVGLSMLDSNGKSIINFVHTDADPSSISSNTIEDLIEDRSNNIWIATDHGLNKMV